MSHHTADDTGNARAQTSPDLMMAPARPSIANCTWKLYAQPVDHFAPSMSGDHFQQRVCLYSQFWRHSQAPIFFYTGNESPVEEYVNNTGLMWELGESMGALLVWAEHRYEPGTHPELCHGRVNCFAFGTSAQALQDYVSLISRVRTEFLAEPAAPVIAFGGSYGGMLSGWLRIRYPHVVAGSIAASAPVWGLASTMQPSRLDWSARAIARGVSAKGGAPDRCLQNIRSSWPLLAHVGRSPAGLRLMGAAARTCKPLRSIRQLESWLKAPWFDMAEGNCARTAAIAPSCTHA